jgi:hypothetical protein
VRARREIVAGSNGAHRVGTDGSIPLVVYPPVAILPIVALNGLRLLVPAALPGDIANALDVCLAKASGMLDVLGGATAFFRLSVLFVKKGLIERVCMDSTLGSGT